MTERMQHRSHSPLGWPYLLIAACALLFAPATQTTAAEVSASISPAKARPNAVVAYSITIKDGKPNAVPNLQLPLQIGQASAPSVQQSYSIVNGVSSAEFVITWGLAAQEPGEFVIAPQDVMVGGQTLKTNEVKFSVVSGGDAPGRGARAAPALASERAPAARPGAGAASRVG